VALGNGGGPRAARAPGDGGTAITVDAPPGTAAAEQPTPKAGAQAPSDR